VNLTVITGGRDNHSGSGPTVLTRNSSTADKHSNNSDRVFAHDTALLKIPLQNYDKVADFLAWLEEEYDDPACNFQQFTAVLTSEEYLGF
jgi:hypothetical protein